VALVEEGLVIVVGDHRAAAVGVELDSVAGLDDLAVGFQGLGGDRDAEVRLGLHDDQPEPALPQELEVGGPLLADRRVRGLADGVETVILGHVRGPPTVEGRPRTGLPRRGGGGSRTRLIWLCRPAPSCSDTPPGRAAPVQSPQTVAEGRPRAGQTPLIPSNRTVSGTACLRLRWGPALVVRAGLEPANPGLKDR